LCCTKFSICVIFFCAVNFADFNAINFGIFAAKFFPSWRQTFTMSTPRGEKFDKRNTFLDFSLKVVFVDMSYRTFDYFFSSSRNSLFGLTANLKKIKFMMKFYF
jgi:hypothetical protein